MIEVFCLPGCAPCAQLCAELDRLGVPYRKYKVDENPSDTAVAKARGYYALPFPVVVKDGSVLPANGIQTYVRTIIEG